MSFFFGYSSFNPAKESFIYRKSRSNADLICNGTSNKTNQSEKSVQNAISSIGKGDVLGHQTTSAQTTQCVLKKNKDVKTYKESKKTCLVFIEKKDDATYEHARTTQTHETKQGNLRQG